MRVVSVFAALVSVNAYYGVDEVPTGYQLSRFWSDSRSFQGHMYAGDPNPCNFDGLKDEEPWATVCTTAHQLCNGDDNMLKWVTRYESSQGAPDADYSYFFGPHSINNYDATMRGENNDYGQNEGEIPPGWAFNPMPTITVTMPKSGLERQLFYQCKHTTTGIYP